MLIGNTGCSRQDPNIYCIVAVKARAGNNIWQLGLADTFVPRTFSVQVSTFLSCIIYALGLKNAVLQPHLGSFHEYGGTSYSCNFDRKNRFSAQESRGSDQTNGTTHLELLFLNLQCLTTWPKTGGGQNVTITRRMRTSMHALCNSTRLSKIKIPITNKNLIPISASL